MKFGCSIGNFLNSAHLICRSTDISQCFRGSLRLRDNESRLYSSDTNLDLFGDMKTSLMRENPNTRDGILGSSVGLIV